MPATTVSASAKSRSKVIPVRQVTNADADAALREGWADFMEMRGDLIFVGLIYVLVGIVAAVAGMLGRCHRGGRRRRADHHARRPFRGFRPGRSGLAYQ